MSVSFKDDDEHNIYGNCHVFSYEKETNSVILYSEKDNEKFEMGLNQFLKLIQYGRRD